MTMQLEQNTLTSMMETLTNGLSWVTLDIWVHQELKVLPELRVLLVLKDIRESKEQLVLGHKVSRALRVFKVL